MVINYGEILIRRFNNLYLLNNLNKKMGTKYGIKTMIFKK